MHKKVQLVTERETCASVVHIATMSLSEVLEFPILHLVMDRDTFFLE